MPHRCDTLHAYTCVQDDDVFELLWCTLAVFLDGTQAHDVPPSFDIFTCAHFYFVCACGKQAPRSSSGNAGRGGGGGITLRADPHMMLLKTLSNEGAAALAMRVVEDLRSREKGDLPPVAYEHLTTAFTVQGDLDQAERTLRMRPSSWWGVTRHRYADFICCHRLYSAVRCYHCF